MCRENKGADQLCSFCTADLRLCFCISKIQFSHDSARTVNSVVYLVMNVVV